MEYLAEIKYFFLGSGQSGDQKSIDLFYTISYSGQAIIFACKNSRRPFQIEIIGIIAAVPHHRKDKTR
jgi:hypothetical protein